MLFSQWSACSFPALFFFILTSMAIDTFKPGRPT